MKSIEDLDSHLSMIRENTDDLCLKAVIDAVLLPQSRILKEKFLSGEEDGWIPMDLSVASELISGRARSLMEKAGQDKSAPQNIALSVGLYCYGAVLCTEGFGAGEFAELFRRCYESVSERTPVFRRGKKAN